MMKKHTRATLLAILPLALGGCFSVKMPEKMFSDAVDASAKAYRSLAGNESPIPGFVFAYTVVVDEATPIKQATEQCFDRIAQHARNEFRSADLVIERVSDAIAKQKRFFSVECRIRAIPEAVSAPASAAERSGSS